MRGLYPVGGYLGKPASYKTGLRRKKIIYVGGQLENGDGVTSDIVRNFNLTGGIASTPQVGDFVVVAFAASVGSAGSTLSYRITTNTASAQRADLFSNDTEDTELQVGTWFMQSTTNSFVTITGGSGSTSAAWMMAISVWRNVQGDGLAMNVPPTTATGGNSLFVNPPSITPVTEGAKIIVIGAAAHTGGVDTFTAPYLSDFLTRGSDDTDDIIIGMGHVERFTDGAYDPAAWTSSQADSTSFSWASVCIALTPALDTFESRVTGIFDLTAVYEESLPRLEGSFITSAEIDSPAVSSYTFTSINIGTAHKYRTVAVTVGWNAGADGQLNSATIGGIPAEIVQNTSGTGHESSAVIYATIPTGTTANIALTFNVTITHGIAIGVYRVLNVTSIASAADVHSATTTTYTTTIDVLPGDYVVSSFGTGNGTGPWVNTSQDYSYRSGANTDYMQGASTKINETASLAISVTGSTWGALNTVRFRGT